MIAEIGVGAAAPEATASPGPEGPPGPPGLADIVVDHVSLRFPAGDSDLLAVDDVSLAVPRGEFVAIVGPSGCGKTTLLNMMAGLLEPSEGEIRVRDGHPRGMHQLMSYMLARDALFPWRTAIRNVMFPLEVKRTGSRADRRRAALSALVDVGLRDFADVYIGKLSQGMRQRVAIARTLVTDPDILFLDEPFGALDAQTRTAVQQMFLRTWEGSDRTVVLVTHDLQEALALADRVVVMTARPGRISLDIQVEVERPRADRLQLIVTEPTFQAKYRQVAAALQAVMATDDGAGGPGGVAL